jgi:hypothetical protein
MSNLQIMVGEAEPRQAVGSSGWELEKLRPKAAGIIRHTPFICEAWPCKVSNLGRGAA